MGDEGIDIFLNQPNQFSLLNKISLFYFNNTYNMNKLPIIWDNILYFKVAFVPVTNNIVSANVSLTNHQNIYLTYMNCYFLKQRVK